jgi:hypothetical protein
MPRLWLRLVWLLAAVSVPACRQRSSPPESLSSARSADATPPPAGSAVAQGKLTLDFIMNGPEDQVQEAIVERVLAVIGDDWNDEVRIVRALPRGLTG